ncbi:MAG: GNAT family N-acetyltransferase [Flavobacteriales bacterium]|jgi:RimJ/RimL family protein N-acetyltransferase|nr:GNAT family N-acetyltransferase [Flavobacteriales bacterium]
MNNFKTKDNRNFHIREAQEFDAEKLIDFTKIIFISSDQILTTIEEFNNSLKQQKDWIKTYSDNPTSTILLAELDGQIVGLLDFTTKKRKKISHTGEFGMSVHPDFQGKGIGNKLIETFLNWVTEKSGIEKITLSVFASNEKAINLYKKFGFIEEGRHIKAIKQNDIEYIDLITMYKLIK